MDAILRGYEVNGPTWFYLSLLLILAVFFRFDRVWSVRNLDLGLLLTLSPGLLIAAEHPAAGYTWLFVGTCLVLVRVWCDPLFRRRPRLEQNLNAPGLAFLCVAAFAFLGTRAMTEHLPESAIETFGRAQHLLSREELPPHLNGEHDPTSRDVQPGPAPSLLYAPWLPLSRAVMSGATGQPIADDVSLQFAARLVAVLAHLAVVSGLIMLARLHFGDPQIGLAMATLYLLLPCTAFDVHRMNHVLPAALIVWALVAFRRPYVAGLLIGLACGTLFFPVFLLPLWFAFYGRKGSIRFGSALATVALVLLGTLMRTSADPNSFVQQIRHTIDWRALTFWETDPQGFWTPESTAWRIPVIVAYAIMVTLLTFLPWRKNVEHLLAHSTAIIVGTQLWYPYYGGTFVLWYLPLLLAVVFRPQISHLTATTAVRQFGRGQAATLPAGSSLPPARGPQTAPSPPPQTTPSSNGGPHVIATRVPRAS